MDQKEIPPIQELIFDAKTDVMAFFKSQFHQMPNGSDFMMVL